MAPRHPPRTPSPPSSRPRQPPRRPPRLPPPKAAQAPEALTPTPVTPEPVEASPLLDEAAAETVVTAVEGSDAPTPEHDALPLPDYDHLTLGSLRARLRALSVDDLLALRAYETAHADRLQVVTMFDNRIAKLSTE